MPRKKPFSVKQKKKQLQDKRERKRGLQDGLRSSSNSRSGSRERREEQTDTSDGESVTHHIRRLNQQPSQGLGPRGYDPNRYRLHFERDSREEVERRKRAAREQVLQPVSAEVLELDIREVYQPGSVLDFPRRPPWSYEMSKEQLMSQEERSFQEYLGKIHGAYSSEKLSYFEHNLETWRQLWRVLEMSDIVLLITDIRHPVVNFPPALYEYVTGELGLALVLVLNKVDLAPPALVVAWKHYFHQHYPQLHVVLFTSFPRDPRTPQDPSSVLKKSRRRGRGWTRALGPEQLLRACEAITVGKGFPNVGKSSLINGLVGRKVVSVSRTPGHTRYFQTYFLTPSVKLCDCPGLIFPSLLPRQLQALLHLRHPEAEDPSAEHPWCAWDICEAWAEKRGYKTAKAARNDVYRAANSLLRLAVDGRLSLCFHPPGYSEQKGTWESHPETTELVVLQGRVGPAGDEEEEEEEELSSSCEEEGEEDRDADEEGEGDEDTPTSAPGSSLAGRNPYALLGEDEC
uniref:Guanine nucleotide-binding protein-like 1 n=1 Tax=Papio anubis TaxID=9555 RepID=A0A2I3MUH6_PAPAN